MKLEDLANFSQVIIYGMGYNGKLALSTILEIAKHKILIFDKNADAIRGIVDDTVRRCNNNAINVEVCVKNFEKLCENHIIVVTPGISHIFNEMLADIPSDSNIISLFQFEDINNYEFAHLLLYPDFRVDSISIKPYITKLAEEPKIKGILKRHWQKLKNSPLTDRLVVFPKPLIIHKECMLFHYPQSTYLVVANKLLIVVVDDEFKVLGIVTNTELVASKGKEDKLTFGIIANTKYSFLTVDEIAGAKNICLNNDWTVVLDENNHPAYLLAKDEPPAVESAYIDLVDSCNLMCPACTRGLRQMPNTAKIMMPETLDDIIRLFNNNYGVRHYSFYNWSEPFLHPNLDKCFDVLQKYACTGSLSTNLALPNIKPMLEKIIPHPALNLLWVSVSGFTQEMQEKYHRGSRIKTIKDNLEFIAQFTSYNLTKKVIVKFLIFDYNDGEVQLFKEYAENLGLGFLSVYGYGNSNSFISADKTRNIELSYQDIYNKYIANTSSITPNVSRFCYIMNQFSINADGDVFLCCCYPNIEFLRVGNILKDSIDDIFLRKAFHPYCKKCEWVKAYPVNTYVRKLIDGL